ncbi:MAG: ribose transport system ATP-binding protein [Granulosicoccus sp.]|jgi:ribose transport system ATP-binding protein
MAVGVGLIPQDRVEESVAASMTIRENSFLNPAASGRTVLSFLSQQSVSKMAYAAGLDVGLRPNSPELPVDVLSVCNQQKVIVGRWLASTNTVLIAEDPTAGVDVGAKAEIYTLLGELVRCGVAVVIISTDFEEVASVANLTFAQRLLRSIAVYGLVILMLPLVFLGRITFAHDELGTDELDTLEKEAFRFSGLEALKR